jgi:predicted transcriptional regulator
MAGEIMFNILKNIIIEQNKILLKQVAEKSNLDYNELCEKYLQPAYYLPLIVKDKPVNG